MNQPSKNKTESSSNYVIFQLGSYPWQAEVEATSGSGILHEAQHEVFNAMEGVGSHAEKAVIFPFFKASGICVTSIGISFT